ncbi:MAG: hypothetical protein ACRERV_12920 [Methylococcales bacterium]
MNKKTQAATGEQDTARDGMLYSTLEMDEKNRKLAFKTSKPKPSRKDSRLLDCHRVIGGGQPLPLSAMLYDLPAV